MPGNKQPWFAPGTSVFMSEIVPDASILMRTLSAQPVGRRACATDKVLMKKAHAND